MYKQKKILILIPARGGSKGIPKKNIKQLCGKPLLAWTLEQARGSKLADEILVSTDDKKIKAVAQKFGWKGSYVRPKEYAKDNSPTIDVITHALKWYGNRKKHFDYLFLLEPTSPLRKKRDLDKAIQLLIDNEDKADSLISLGEVCNKNPYITKIIKKGYVTSFVGEKSEGIYQRQQLPLIYFPTGIVYGSKIDLLIKQGTFYQERTIPYFTERWQNYEVDDIYDFICIEAILKYKKEEES